MKRSKHNLSHYHLTSINMGDLVPIMCEEVLPGDSFRHNVSAFLRVAPLVNPVMHPVHVNIRSFFVPNRLLWSSWEDFITGGRDGTSAPTPPTMTLNVAVGSLPHYLGLRPIDYTSSARQSSALPIRAYNKIINDYYIDQELVTPRVIPVTSGADTTSSTGLFKVAWNKDYFTTSRPNAQKGAAVKIPALTNMPIVTNTQIPTFNVAGGVSNAGLYSTDATVQRMLPSGVASAGDTTFGNESGLQGQLAASMGSIQELRLASALLRYEENRSRYGSRYTEYLRYLGVRSSDARLQRAEYLGGGRSTIQFSEVLQTAPNIDTGTSEDTGVGNLFGHGAASARSNRYMRYFEEHGFVLTLMSVVPITCYGQGRSKMWTRTTKEDYWQKELEHVGQEEVSADELYAAGTAADDDVWGYSDRYESYRTRPNRVSGEFIDDLKTWNMYREFSSLPTLNADFVSSNPTNRIYQDNTLTESYQLYVMAYHNLKTRRLVTKNPTPLLY